VIVYSVMIIGCLVSPPYSCFGDEIATAPSIKDCQTVGIASVGVWTRKHPGVAFEKVECVKQER
jgi:hypothetical protein